MGRKPRFPGAGTAAEEEFNRELRQNLRDEWKSWTAVCLGIVGFAVWSGFTGGVATRFLAAAAGGLGGMFLVALALGGHVSTFRWYLGSEGERMTGKKIEKLSGDWHCEHAIKHEYGDWDHVLVGPPGVFLIDSKFTHGTAVAARDALRVGRLRYDGGRFRGSALDVNRALNRHLSHAAPYVQAVAVVWGDFPQQRHEEDRVVYVAGEELVAWLEEQPPKLGAPDRAALVVALKEVRTELSTAKPEPESRQTAALG